MGQERTELTGRLREDIERTRADMSWTIGEIEDRLKPEHLMRRAKRKVRGAAAERMRDMMNSANQTAGRMADRAQHSAETVAGRVRENPLPLAALAVAGLAWWMSRDKQQGPGAATGDVMPRRSGQLRSALGEHPVQTALLAGTVGYLLMNRQRPRDEYPMEGFGDTMDRPGQGLLERAADTAHQTKDAVAEYAGEVREAAASGAAHVRDTVSDYSGKARETIGGYARGAQSTASEATGRLREKTRHLAEDMQQRWQHTGPAVERWIHDNPLTVGAAALAVGAAVGLSAPRTRAENRTLGETRDALVDKASTAARDVREKVSETARTVVQDATEAARAATPPVGSATTPSGSDVSAAISAPPSSGEA